LFSAAGIPVNYSGGTGWSLKFFNYSKDNNGIMKDLQCLATIQILHQVALFGMFGWTQEGLYGLLFWWIVPVLVGYPVVNIIHNLEHINCEVSNKEPHPPLRNTARSMKSNLFLCVLLWDTNYHVEHHCYPMVPFFNLHKLNELMYDTVIHNDKDYFITEQWEAFRSGGWIDQQSADMSACRRKMEKKAE
jgi:fatty acid desaturase